MLLISAKNVNFSQTVALYIVDEVNLTIPATDTYSRFYPDGHIVYFDTQNRHDYTLYPDGRVEAYTYNPDGSTATMAVTAPGQSVPTAVWIFNYASGRLDSITDPTGRIIDFTVDANNQLRQVDIPGMGSRQFNYNQDNLLTQQIDEAGAVTSYGYDVYGRIASHQDPTRAVYDPLTGKRRLLENCVSSQRVTLAMT